MHTKFVPPALLALLSFLSLPLLGQSSAKADIEQVLHQQQDAWNHHNLEAFMSGYWNSSELMFFSGAKKSSGWQATLDHYRNAYQADGREMGHLEFSDLNIQELASDAAFVCGTWALTVGDRNPHGLFTLVFRKFPEGWKIVHDHTSVAE